MVVRLVLALCVLGACACLVAFAVAVVDWAQALIAQHGRLTVALVTGLGFVLCAVVGAFAFFLAVNEKD